MKKNVSIKDVVPLISATVNEGGKFRLYPKGISMYPLLREGKDSVLLAKCDEIKKNDILLYKRKSGNFILHRVVSTKRGLVFCGDNQRSFEYGITKDDVIAKVCGIYRREKYYDINSPCFDYYLKYINSKRRFYSFLGKGKRKLKSMIKQK